MSELARERCQACTPGTKTLAAGIAQQLAGELDDGWELGTGQLRRRFKFRNFADAFTLATRIALIAEREAHHPQLTVGWGLCEVELTTHAAGGLTRNDFIMAAKIDRVAASGAGTSP